MNIQTQREILIRLLEEDYKSKGQGIDRVWVTQNYFIVDVPTRIFDIRDSFIKKGFRIVNLREKPGKGTRVALYKLKPLESQPSVEEKYTFIGDRAYLKGEEPKPEQQVLI